MGTKVGGRFKREGTYIYLWLIHVDVWQKPTQFCKVIILRLKINKSIKNNLTVITNQTPGNSLVEGFRLGVFHEAASQQELQTPQSSTGV